ncbi:MAG: Hsp70 family protein [Acidobacteriia bacterium]|nr:Hsp70 family protein [Terriglobia bacterium]
MKLGIDFGTTRIVAAAADRGNYPLVGFEGPDGQTRDWLPPLIAVSEEGRRFVWDAWSVQGDPKWTVIRSVKRLLKQAGPNTELAIGNRNFLIAELVTELLLALRRQLRKQSTLEIERGEPLEVMIGVPANANSNQRFLTSEAFRAAGFQVLGILNEPSAASVEFGHRSMSAAGRKSLEGRSLLVYDLGGGTFDASLVEIEENIHTIEATAGIPDLGGDDFDEILAGLAMEGAGIGPEGREALSAAQWFQLCEECRERKEALNPNTRKLVIDLERVQPGWGEVSLAVGDFYERCRPLIERTEAVVEGLLAGHGEDSRLEALYVTGGGSELPAVSRILKENFGRKVRRSQYMRSATAIGLAISADDRSSYIVKDRLARYFGVWRESDHGENVAFDLLFPRGLELPRNAAGPIRASRAYVPAHNIGHFRYVECSGLGPDGQPAGDLTVWDDIRFPFDPDLREVEDLQSVAVSRKPAVGTQTVEEEYTCDISGMMKVTITDQTAGYRREYALGRWSAKTPGITASAAPAKRNWSRRHRESR